jgi:hypothetical protein
MRRLTYVLQLRRPASSGSGELIDTHLAGVDPP